MTPAMTPAVTPAMTPAVTPAGTPAGTPAVTPATARARAWWTAAALLAGAALGLPWTGQLAGAAHPARVAVVAALVLAVAGLRTGRDGLLSAAAAAGVLGVLAGGLDPTPGRVALAGAVLCLGAGCAASGRRLLPVRSPAG